MREEFHISIATKDIDIVPEKTSYRGLILTQSSILKIQTTIIEIPWILIGMRNFTTTIFITGEKDKTISTKAFLCCFRIDPYMLFGLLAFLTFIFYVTFNILINNGNGRSYEYSFFDRIDLLVEQSSTV